MSSRLDIWSRDELILMMDAYLSRRSQSRSEQTYRRRDYHDYLCQPKFTGWLPEREQFVLQLFVEPVTKRKYEPKASDMASELLTLSNVLNSLAKLLNPTTPCHRTPNEISEKLFEFSCVDSNHQYRKLQDVNVNVQDVQQVWNEFNQDEDRFRILANAIKKAVEKGSSPAPSVSDEEGVEGGLLLKLHMTRERNKKLVLQKKKQVLKQHGSLACEACDFVFSNKYGTLGDGFIECHHTVPISRMPPNGITRLKDLALVCSNCHRMLHSRGELSTIAELRSIIVATSKIAGRN